MKVLVRLHQKQSAKYQPTCIDICIGTRLKAGECPALNRAPSGSS